MEGEGVRRECKNLLWFGRLVALDQCWDELLWLEVLAHAYPSLHHLGRTLTHKGGGELVEEGRKPLEPTPALLEVCA